MIKQCPVIINNGAVTVIKFGDIDVQLPYCNKKDIKTLNVKFERTFNETISLSIGSNPSIIFLYVFLSIISSTESSVSFMSYISSMLRVVRCFLR